MPVVADGSALEVGIAGTVQCCYSEHHCVGGSGHHGQWFVAGTSCDFGCSSHMVSAGCCLKRRYSEPPDVGRSGF